MLGVSRGDANLPAGTALYNRPRLQLQVGVCVRHQAVLRASAAIAVLTMVASACGSGSAIGATSAPIGASAGVPSTTIENPAQADLNGFLAIASNGAVFLQWTRSGDSVSGSVTQTLVSGMQLQPSSGTFTGVVNSSSVTLTFSAGFGQTWNGTLNGNQLLLSYAASDGSLGTLTFTPATVADYNSAVAQLRAQVDAEQASSAAASAAAASAAAAQQQVQQEQAAIDRSIQAVRADFQAVQSDAASLNSDVQAVQSDLAAQQNDVKSAYADLQTTLSDKQHGVDNGTVCGDAGTVAGDVGTVQGDEGTVEGDGGTINADVTTLSNDAQTLQRDFSALQQAVSSLPTYQPSGLPSQQDVSTATASASTAVAQAQLTYAGYLEQAKQAVQQAQGYANQAQQACGQ